MTRPILDLIVWLAIEALFIGLGNALTMSASHVGRRVGAWVLVGMILPAIMIIRTLIRGFVSAYAYIGGLVYARNGRIRVVPWEDLAGLRVIVGNPGSILAGKVGAYDVIPKAGSPLRIAAELGGPDPLGTYLVNWARSLNLTIVEEVYGSRVSAVRPTLSTRRNGFFVLAAAMAILGVFGAVRAVAPESGSSDSGQTVGVCWTVAAYAYAIWAFLNRPASGTTRSVLKVPMLAAAVGTVLLVATLLLG